MFLLNFLTLLLVLVLLFILLLFIYPVKVAATFNSEQQPEVDIMISWLGPLFKADITRQNGKTTLSINIFNSRVFVKQLAIKKDTPSGLKEKNYMDLINMARSIKINNAKLFASYGFGDPYVTGMLCGAIDFLSEYINLHELYNDADLFTVESYFNISAQADVNAGISLMRILKRNKAYSSTEALNATR